MGTYTKSQGMKTIIWFVLCGVIAYIVTFALHGYAHTIIACLYGQNDTPWLIVQDNYWLHNVAENIEYHDLVMQEEFFKADMIAISGYLVNWALLIFAMLKIANRHISRPLVTFYYLLATWNLTAVLHYVPLHVLEPTTELNHAFHEVDTSVWMFYFVGSVASLSMIYFLIFRLLPIVLELLNIKQRVLHLVYLLIPLFIVLFYSTCRYIFTSWGFYQAICDITFWIKFVVLTIILYAYRIQIMGTQ